MKRCIMGYMKFPPLCISLLFNKAVVVVVVCWRSFISNFALFFHFCSWTLKVDSVTYGIRTVVSANLSSSLGSVAIHGEKETKMTGTLSCKSMSPKSMWQSSVSWTLRMLGRGPWRGSSWSTMYLMVSMAPLLLRCSLMGQGWRQSCKKESSKILRE